MSAQQAIDHILLAQEVGILKVDPTGHWAKQGARFTEKALIETCGLLPFFALQSIAKGNQDLHRGMMDEYKFGLADTKEHVRAIDDNGVLHYPGDPEQYPVMEIYCMDQICYIYPYAMVAFVKITDIDENRRELICYTRMD